MPPRAAPFDTPPVTVSLVAVSAHDSTLTFSAAVATGAGGAETAIVDTTQGGSPNAAAGQSATTINVDLGLSFAEGDTVVFTPPAAVLAPVEGGAVFQAGSVVVGP